MRERKKERKRAQGGNCVNREVGLGSHFLSHSSPVPNKPCGLSGRKAPGKKTTATELRSCVNMEVVGQGSHFLSQSSPIPNKPYYMVSVDVKHLSPVPNKPYGFCRHKAPGKKKTARELRNCVKREVGLGSHFLSHSSPVPNKPHGFCGRKAPGKRKHA